MVIYRGKCYIFGVGWRCRPGYFCLTLGFAGTLQPAAPKTLFTMKREISEETVLFKDVLAPHRSIAYDAMTDIMLEALEELSGLLNDREIAGEEGWSFNRSVCGFKPEQLEKISTIEKAGGPVTWLSCLTEGEKMGLMMSFMDWDRLRMQEFRSRYPKSFTKWDPSEDEALLEMYAHRPSWRALSSHFGRNINAVKLRLQHLGVDLGAEARRARYLRRPGTRAAVSAEGGSPEE